MVEVPLYINVVSVLVYVVAGVSLGVVAWSAVRQVRTFGRGVSRLTLFVVLAVFIKTRELRFRRRGGTHEEYQQFLLTNRNSLHFSAFAGTDRLRAVLQRDRAADPRRPKEKLKDAFVGKRRA